MIAVIADDLSGAAELASLAWERGLAAEVQTAFNPATNAEVIAIDSDTRCCSAEQAGQGVRELAQRLHSSRPSWIYKKTDSVLRGHVRAELTSLLAATGKERALLIPANPKRGRVIRSGQYYVNDTPLDRTVFAADPEHPATSADVRVLMCRDAGADVHLGSGIGILPTTGIVVPDVTNTADLIHHAACVDETTLPAGAAEFFDALLTTRSGRKTLPVVPAQVVHHPARTLFVCGSAAAWPATRQGCECREIPVFPMPSETFPPANEGGGFSRAHLSTLAAMAATELNRAGCALIAVGEPVPPSGCSPSMLLRALAHTVALILAATPADQVLLEGGATAAAVLHEMGWTRLAVEGHFASGLASLRVIGQSGPLLAIKPGSYAWPENIWPLG